MFGRKAPPQLPIPTIKHDQFLRRSSAEDKIAYARRFVEGLEAMFAAVLDGTRHEAEVTIYGGGKLDLAEIFRRQLQMIQQCVDRMGEMDPSEPVDIDRALRELIESAR